MQPRGLLRNRTFWYAAGLVALPLWGAGQVARRVMYAPNYPDIALRAGLALAGGEIVAAVLPDGEKGGNRPALGDDRRMEQRRWAPGMPASWWTSRPSSRTSYAEALYRLT